MKKFFLALFIFVVFVTPINKINAQDSYRVTKVVDGDTLTVDLKGKKEVVRLLGIDTPETVDPRKPVQCFAKEATKRMTSLVQNKSVTLVSDGTQGNRDKYKRLLRYVYLSDASKTFVNETMIKEGYAFSYREYPTKMLNTFNAAEKYAREHNLGLWSSCPISPTRTTIKAKTAAKTVVKKIKKVTIPTRTYVAPTKTYVAPTSAPVVQQNTSTSSAGGEKDCKDFGSQGEAQAYFNARGGSASNNVDRLDGNDHDGIVCESL